MNDFVEGWKRLYGHEWYRVINRRMAVRAQLPEIEGFRFMWGREPAQMLGLCDSD